MLELDAAHIIAAFADKPIEALGVDGWNALAQYWRDIDADTPGKLWWHQPHDHPAIAKALKVDRTQPGAVYALSPFRYAKIDGQHLILAAYPAPKVFDPIDLDWLNIETVLAWDPVSNQAWVMGDDCPQLIGRPSDEFPTLYADPRAFFTAWMMERARYATLRQQMARLPFAHIPREFDPLPGALIVGDPDKVNWPVRTMTRHFQCVGIEPKRVNRAILKSAALPMATGFDVARAA